ncbi:hypothetical protein LCGC14_2995460 [marine sediment metagenome]|uniref:Uncharacterized protein n=1 Tax=marine sediment metagenome TaxID=412755 RepID=A0A0F8ZTP6_9ZZZZ
MGGICYKRYAEKGLWFEIQSIQKTIDIKEKQGKDASLEKSILKAYKKLTEEDYNGIRQS